MSISLRGRTCCFTGHRHIPPEHLPGIMKRTEQIVRQLIQQGVVYFGVGGAIGYDTEAAKLLFRLQKVSPQIKVILVYPFHGFTNRWNSDQKRLFAQLLPHYAKTVRIAEDASREAYLARDRHLVDGSAYCICYCTRSFGGTAYTVRYAQQQGITIYNVAE